MRLTPKLLGFLNRVFNKEPDSFLAMRVRHKGGVMSWQVKNATLTLSIPPLTGASPVIDLTQHTIGSLMLHIAGLPNFQIEYGAGIEMWPIGARTLIDGSGDMNASNGDHILAYQSPLWAYMESAAKELADAEAQIKEMLRQMSTITANGEWLDEIGGYYGIPRLQLESDASYGPRIITETLRPRGNNIALEIAIRDFTGQVAKVTDVTLYTAATPIHDAAITHNAAFTYNAGSGAVYGLFDVEYGYNLIEGGDLAAFAIQVRELIDRMRDAGTHLRQLNLTGGALNDDFTAPSDGGPGIGELVLGLPLDDTLTAPSEAFDSLITFEGMSDSFGGLPPDEASITITRSGVYDGTFTHDGTRLYQGGSETELLGM